MATKSRTSFQKRQKEIARMEKQREKMARRLQRSQARKPSTGSGPEIADLTNPSDAPPSITE